MLELQAYAEHISCRTRIEVIIYAVAGIDFRIKSFVLRNHKWILNGSVNTAADATILAGLKELTEGIAKRDIVEAQEAGVAYEIVAHIIICLAREAKIDRLFRNIGIGTIRIDTGPSNVSLIAQEVIVEVVIQTSAHRKAEVPILIQELVSHTHRYVSCRLFVDVLIIFIDDAVAIAVYEDTFQGASILVVHLLINVEAICRSADDIGLYFITQTARDAVARFNNSIVARELSNLITIPSCVVSNLPREVVGNNRTRINRKFETCITERTDVLIVIYGGRETSIEEREVHTGVPRRRTFPLQVWIISFRTIDRKVFISERILRITVALNITR